jgi:hypothetical protein
MDRLVDLIYINIAGGIIEIKTFREEEPQDFQPGASQKP